MLRSNSKSLGNHVVSPGLAWQCELAFMLHAANIRTYYYY